jgi:hypothetical protein
MFPAISAHLSRLPQTVRLPTRNLVQNLRSSFPYSVLSSSTLLRLETNTSLLGYVLPQRVSTWVNVQAIEHNLHGKWHDGETFLAECLMTLVLHGQLPRPAETEVESDQFHDDVNLVHRSYVTYPDRINVSKGAPLCTTQFITKMNSFGPIFGRQQTCIQERIIETIQIIYNPCRKRFLPLQ